MDGLGYNRLGDWLLQAGILQSWQVRAGLDEQARSGRRLGDILVELGWATERQVAQCLAEQYGLTLIHVEEHKPTRTALGIMPPLFCLTHLILPLKFDPATSDLTMALADPLDLAATDEVTQSICRRPTIVLAPADELKRAIVAAYRLPKSVLDEPHLDPSGKPAERDTARDELIHQIQELNRSAGFWERISGGRG